MTDVPVLTTHRWRFWRTLFRRWSALLGLTIVAVITLTAVAAPWLAPYDPLRQNLTRMLTPPGDAYALGADGFGRDVLSRIIWGSRVSVAVGLLSVLLGATFGSVIGVVAGFFGGRIDGLIMRLVDIAMSFPLLLLAIAIVTVFGRGMANLVVAIGIGNIPHFARLTRGETLRIRGLEYVDASRALGASAGRIILRDVVPNMMATIVVLTTLRTSFAVLTESSLSFLGLGLPPPLPSWGVMLAEGQRFLTLAPWVSIFPGTAIALLVLGLNLFGDGLRDALDPRLTGE
ncbi:MAG: ABC transporter permease [Armatimonadetes bacterium]|nr:ABC transporter permease [Armatimonadota bacterium]